MRPSRIITVAALAATCTLGLAACTTPDSPKPSSTSTTTPTAATTVYNDCIDDAAQIWDEETPKNSPSAKDFTMGDCTGVNIISSDATITLGAVQTLTIEGSNNTVTVKTPTTITITGSNNTVHHTGDTPTITDEGQHNTVKPQ